MRPEVLRAVFDNVLASSLVEDPIVFVWHLGEPLTVPLRFYEDAFALAAKAATRYGRQIRHSFQTNATLINDAWVDLIQRHQIAMGVSVDGPAFIHDQSRLNRVRGGTHTAVMRGICRLQRAGIGFSAISVLTDFTLDYPDEFYDFFVEQAISSVGFNIDEIEGVNTTSSIGSASSPYRYERFLASVLERSEHHRGAVKIREVWTNVAAMAFGGLDPMNTTNQPFRILTIDHVGNVTTFSPELATARPRDGGSFAIGNVLSESLDAMARSSVFQRVSAEIAAGVQLCKDTCDYWTFCGGGSPSNKFFEHGRFDVAETHTCRVHKKATVDVLIRHLENRTGIAGESQSTS